ncbi:MAG: transcriptional repressor [Treponema sp.]|nr:transcriptional repressor [Treponema sp.]
MTYKTEQRNLLLNFLQNNPDTMFSASQIEQALSSENISRSAVYRNLAELEANNKIKRCAKTGSREVFYQYYDTQNCKNHIHLSCTKCGKIFHMANTIADVIVNDVETSEGFEINRGETTIYGVCKDCHSQNFSSTEKLSS